MKHARKKDRSAAGPGNPTSFFKNRKTSYWCTKHKPWGLHLPELCRLPEGGAEANVAETGTTRNHGAHQAREGNINAFIATLHAIGEDDDANVE